MKQSTIHRSHIKYIFSNTSKISVFKYMYRRLKQFSFMLLSLDDFPSLRGDRKKDHDRGWSIQDIQQVCLCVRELAGEGKTNVNRINSHGCGAIVYPTFRLVAAPTNY